MGAIRQKAKTLGAPILTKKGGGGGKHYALCTDENKQRTAG